MDKRINLPNRLTITRIILVPAYMIFIMLPSLSFFAETKNIDTWCRIIAAALFLIAAITDLLDGIIARRGNLMTDFGALMDPLADKFMVIGALLAITASYDGVRIIAVWVTAIVFFRELAVTSLRLIANTSDGTVIAASKGGKIKTVLQCVCIMTIILEPIVLTQSLNTPAYLFSYIMMALMCANTIYSGVIYFKTYWKYIDPVK